MKSALLLGAAALLASSASSAAAPQRSKEPAKRPAARAEAPKKEYFQPTEVRSTGSVTVGGQPIAFEAIAGTLVVHAKDWSDTDALDASLLLIPLLRFLHPDDARVRDTVLAIERDLTRQGFGLRYVTHETDDGLHGEEGTFTICSFWLVSALSEIGEPARARALCERLLGSAGGLGLFAEEIDPVSGRHLGNYPQAFTHLALINAVMHVIQADQGLEIGHLPLGRELSRPRSPGA